MFRSIAIPVFVAQTFIVSPVAMTHAVEKPNRVALLIADEIKPSGACHLPNIRKTLKDLHFDARITSGADIEADTVEFSKRSANADAAIVYACNQEARAHLPEVLKASELNFLFLLRTNPVPAAVFEADRLKTTRNDLMIVHVQINTPENDEIFARTLINKLKRQYSKPRDIISRTVVSTYYESRGTMLIDTQGSIVSSYLLSEPPIDKILDAWSRVQYSKDRAKLEAFIAKYPQTLFADLARSRIEKLPAE